MGVRVRGATLDDTAAIARVHVDTWRTTYRGLVADEYLSSLSYDQRQKTWEGALRDPTRRTTLLVAEEGAGRIIGFAACGPAREEKEFEGELYAIYVDQGSQGKGVGGELVRAVVKDLKARGMKSMIVWVLADNPFKKFYEALGGAYARTKDVEIGGRVLKESGYGWKNLDPLSG